MADKIREYTAGKGGPRPDDGAMATAREAASVFQREANTSAQAWRQVGQSLGGIADDYEKQQALQEISHGSAALAQIQNGLTQTWNNTANSADINDQSVDIGFRDKTMEPALEKFTQQFQTEAGQKWAIEQTNSLRNHLFQKTAADMSTRAGDAIITNLAGVKKNLVATVERDPTSFDNSIGMVDSTIDALVANSSRLSVADASATSTRLKDGLKSDLAKAAIFGMAQGNPAAAMEDLKSGKFDSYLTEAGRSEAVSTINAMDRLKRTQERAAVADQDRQDTAKAQAYSGQVIAGAIQTDGSLRITPDFFASAAKLLLAPKGLELGKEMLRMGEAAIKDQREGRYTITDPHTYDDFSQRLLSADPASVTDREIYAARTDGRLADKDMTFLIQERTRLANDPNLKEANKQFQQFLASQKSAFTKTTILGGKDPVGDQKFFQFSQQARALFNKAYSDGKWHDALDATKPNFIGRVASQYLGKPTGQTVQQVVVPRFQTDAEVEGYLKTAPRGSSFWGPDGKQHWKK